MKIRTIIVEDEKNSQELLMGFLSIHCPEVEVIGISKTVSQAKELIESLSPDLVFLDIELEDGLGFDLLNSFSTFEFITIFITGYEQYTIEAIRHAAVDYILKPFSIIELKAAIGRVKSRIESWTLLRQVEQLEGAPIVNSSSQTIIVSSEKGHRVINFEQIICVSADEPYCRVHLSDNSQILVQYALKNILELLPEYFFKIHRSHIVNLNVVVKWDRGRGGNATLSNGKVLPISYRSKKDFIAAIKNFNALR